ncbi:hypothetical protein CEXT_540691 [Caerostris extrusa]|uniref:Uncharacterized protein n=1 Tax=Caerostris extrusa TaxID=172846 RepID=A0AAV4NHF1_CAEEX|nr:hypothetical protein CEXT_540691 [Caerostris extrusa]
MNRSFRSQCVSFFLKSPFTTFRFLHLYRAEAKTNKPPVPYAFSTRDIGPLYKHALCPSAATEARSMMRHKQKTTTTTPLKKWKNGIFILEQQPTSTSPSLSSQLLPTPAHQPSRTEKYRSITLWKCVNMVTDRRE